MSKLEFLEKLLLRYCLTFSELSGTGYRNSSAGVISAKSLKPITPQSSSIRMISLGKKVKKQPITNSLLFHQVDKRHRIYIIITSVADRRCPPPPRVRFLSFSCNFREKFGQIIGFCPHLWGWRPPPASGKFWIRDCTLINCSPF